MRGFWRLTWIECKLYFRFPIGVFFTLILPLMLLLLMGTAFGNEPAPMYGGMGPVDMSVPAYTAMVIGISALISLPINLATYRERGILRRFRATPVRPAVVLGAQLMMQFGMTALGMLLMIAAGKVFFNLRFTGNAASVLGAFLLGSLSFFSVGMILAGILPNTRLASIAGNVLLQPMVYLSGATIPLEVMPQRLRDFTRFIPLTYVVTLMKGMWVGDAWGRHLLEVGVLAGILVIGAIVSLKTFRWE